MEWLDTIRSHALALPNLARFAIVMAIIAGAPALARRTRVPELVGLVAFGILLGPYVLDVWPKNHPTVQFFGDLGRLLLMFGAGLEININLFRKAQPQAAAFRTSDRHDFGPWQYRNRGVRDQARRDIGQRL
jgi:Kef-type K+ transport system membrane component KefB